MSTEAKYTLITNLDFIQQEGSNLRLFCRALLITEGLNSPMLGITHNVRGFGMEPAWENFSLVLERAQLPVKIEQGAINSRIVMLGEEGDKPKPIFGGGWLVFADGTRWFLQAGNMEHAIDVLEMNCEIMEVWDQLSRKTVYHYDLPNRPTLQYVPHKKVSAVHVS